MQWLQRNLIRFLTIAAVVLVVPPAQAQEHRQLCAAHAKTRFKPPLAVRQSPDPVIRAIYTSDSAEVLREALRGQDPNAPRGKSPIRPLAHAAGIGNMEAMRQLLAVGAKRDLLDANGESALSHAVIGGQAASVCWLLQQGASLPAPSTKPHLLPMAAAADDLASARLLTTLLLHAGYDWRARAMGDTALHVAAERGDPVLLNRLLAAGADPLLRNERQQTAVEVARQAYQSEVLRLLSEHPKVQRHAP